MTIDCFNCKKELENHDSQQMIVCLTTLSKKMESMQKNLKEREQLKRSFIICL